MKKLYGMLIIAVFMVAVMVGAPSAVCAGQWNLFDAANNGDTETFGVQTIDKTQQTTKLLTYGMGVGVDLAVGDTIKATVSGATFDDKAWYLLNSSGGGNTLLKGTHGVISVLNSDTTTVTYRVTTDGTDLTGIAKTDTNGNFFLGEAVTASPVVAGDNAMFDLTGLTSGAYVALKMDIQTNLGVAVDNTPVSYNVIEGIDVGEVTTETASATTVIDVASEKKKIKTSAGVDQLATEAATYSVKNNTPTIDDQELALQKVLYTITGDMSAVDTITGAGVTSCNATGTVGTGPGVGNWYVDAANGKAYAVNSAAINNGTLVLNDIVVTFDGNNVIPEGSYTIQATYLGDAAVSAWTLDPTPFTFLTLAYNGTVVYPGIVIGSGFGYSGGFRLVNRSTLNAKVYFQVQNYDGDMLPEVEWSGSPLQAGKTVYIETDTVLTEGGLTTTSSANGIITVESSNSVDIYPDQL